MEPPQIQFQTRVYHPNIDDVGRICCDLLNLPPKVGRSAARACPLSATCSPGLHAAGAAAAADPATTLASTAYRTVDPSVKHVLAADQQQPGTQDPAGVHPESGAHWRIACRARGAPPWTCAPCWPASDSCWPSPTPKTRSWWTW
jgi:hypothetical protein